MLRSLRENIARTCCLPRNDALLLNRARMLPRDERELVVAFFVHGQSVKSLASLVGRPTGTVRSRLWRLARRLASQKFLDVMRALPYLSPEDAALARMRYGQNLPRRVLCSRLGIKRYALTRRLVNLNAQVQALRRVRNPSLVREAIDRLSQPAAPALCADD
ncbi:MAG TPA: hypothetical protein DCX07_01485 [Phycisphaerales bacterium]|nr:hypothetical protein [Phycisphaerales bacterium]